jgi:transglutaminase-like putative cysteine protease
MLKVDCGHESLGQLRQMRRRSQSIVGLTLLLFLMSRGAAAAPPAGKAAVVTPTAAVEYGPSMATRYRVGATIVARGGTVENIRVMVAVPLECPEQQVEILEEAYSPEVESVEFRQTDEGVRQMLIYVPTLPPREEAEATVTYEVHTSPILPPKEPESFRAPKKVNFQLKRYLGPSPFIDVNNRKIRAAVKEALAAPDDEDTDDAASSEPDPSGAEAASEERPQETAVSHSPAAAEPRPLTDWRRVEKLYDYAIERVKYEEGDDKSALEALADGKGDCQAIAALFVAMCRTEKVPARMVWVDGHQYAEFYLEDETGAGRWFPVESAGRREFGEMSIARVILQKGDNFRVPERPRERLRYASDYTLLLSKPGRQPKIAYVREQL